MTLAEENTPRGSRAKKKEIFGVSRNTYQLVFSKYLLAPSGEVDFANAHLPAGIAPSNRGIQGPRNDLVAEADADDPHAVLGENFGCVGHEVLDPGRVVESVETCR